ncbi:MAG: class I SAM-dependent RNA methyltransferase [Opitutaceae bacterium]|nr:class I SAM-dependent RNA methyltransferase [Opitutaceae bacterium]
MSLRVFSVGKNKFNSDPFPYHAELELEIASLTNLGVGVGRVPHPADPAARWVVMVPFALPGERVRARVFRNHKNFSEADLLAVLTPSPDRIEPVCPLFARCGGCQYQNFAYPAQLAWKRRQVEELLQRMADTTFPVAPVIGSPREYGYRSKITPHFHAPRTPEAAAELPIGFLRQGTRFDLLDVPACPIATDAINARLAASRAHVRARAAEGAYARGGTLLLRDASGHVTTDYDEVVTETVGDLKLRFLARDFFQNNPFILPAFTAYARDQAAASGARFLVDAYCGSGLFALTAARAFEQVAGIEISESSIAFARQNAAANGLANVTFQAGDASAIFAGLSFPAADTVVLIDPPRKGCDESFLSQLFGYSPRAVVYVSCDPATQMRDLKSFLAAGYELTAVQPFDLFPQTRHLECVITLRKA